MKRSSEIDKSYKIHEEQWVLTLARKTKGAHPQHAFLILEGIKNAQAVIYFMDLVGPKLAPFLPNIKDARIRVECFTANSKNELTDAPLLFRCQEKMMDLREGDDISSLTRYITSENAEKLIKSIREDQENPPIFNIFGESSLLTGSSAYSSSRERGHNCFTYAKEKIENLGIEIGSNESTYYINSIAAITSFTLKGPAKPSSYCPYFAMTTVGLLGLAVATTYFVKTSSQDYSP